MIAARGGSGYNTAVGEFALAGNFAANPLVYVTGAYNSAFGTDSLKVMTSGSKNIGIGYQAGNNITTGDNNVVIGAADVASATGDSQLSISDGDGGTTWITGTEAGVVNIPGSLTVAGSAVGGASDIGALDDVSMDITNFVNSLLIQTDSDTSAPTTGTLSSATGNVGIGKGVFTALTLSLIHI